MGDVFYQLIGAASGWGAQVVDTECAPQLIQDVGLVDQLTARGIPAGWGPVLYPSARYTDTNLPLDSTRLPMIASHCVALGRVVSKTIQKGLFPVVFGGDHAVAMGTWSGVTHGLKASGSMGLLWMDAHMDAHTPETTPSGAYHGMPLAHLLGHGLPELSQILSPKPKIDPRHLVLFGIRSFEEGEQTLLESLGVRIFYREEIRERGVGTCLEEALQRVTKGTRAFGVSLDLDMFDPCVAPGVGSPADDGLFPGDLWGPLEMIMSHQSLCALEVVELNPRLDVGGMTLGLLTDLVLRSLSYNRRSHNMRLAS